MQTRRHIVVPAVVLAGIPLVALVAHSLRLPGAGEAASVVATGLLVGAAAAAVGAFLGFLFGLPRTAGATEGGNKGEHRGEQSEGHDALRYRPNTNLEQVSDWLTKILVGAGLTQLGTLGRSFGSLANFVGPSLGGGRAGEVVGGALVGYGVVGGFLGAFLTTRIYLAGAFTAADAAVLRRQREDVQAILATVPEEDESEAATLSPTEVARVQQQVAELEQAGEALDDVSYRRLARQLKRMGRYHDAIAAYLRAFELNPRDPAPLNYAGAIHSKYLHEYKQAEDLYRRAMAVNPSYVSPIYNLACNAARQNDRATALRLLAVAVAGDGKYAALAERDAEGDGPFVALADDPEFKRLTGAGG